jgi:hypothetical protein
MKFAKSILRFKNLFPNAKGISKLAISNIEKSLNVLFPCDFAKITEYYSGGQIGSQSILNISDDIHDSYGIIEVTKEFRKAINFPPNCVVLYYEYGLIYMETQKDKNISTPIIYCSDESACNLHITGKPEVVYSSFPSFTDFFAYLLDEEEKMREEEYAEATSTVE